MSLPWPGHPDFREMMSVMIEELGHDDPNDTISFLALCNGVLRQWRVVPISVGVALVLGLTFALVSDRAYVVESSFTPETADGSLQGPSTALQRVGLGFLDGTPLSFYTELLRSRELLKDAVTTEYEMPATADGRRAIRVDLATLYGIGGDTERDRIQRSIDELAKNISVSTEPAAGIVRLRVRTSSPELGIQVNRRLLTLLNDFDVARRQGRASSERTFVEERLAEVQAELTMAEQSLERFYEENRAFNASPQLTFAASRLERRINLLQEIYLALARSYEQIKIEEVRATPLITIVDPPEWSLPRAGSPIWLRLVLWLMVGLGVGITLALIADFATRQPALNPSDYREFRHLLGRAGRKFPGVSRRRASHESSPAGSRRSEPHEAVAGSTSGGPVSEVTGGGP
jgi:uncharacterized protein involved in exopolysaccharide biosynthesis